MIFTCEELEPLDDISPEQLNEILSSDSFGKFAILSQSDSDYIQAACDWQPTQECSEFLEEHRSDPWIIEYRDGETSAHFRAEGYVTLDAVASAFASYLCGNEKGRSSFNWQPVVV